MPSAVQQKFNFKSRAIRNEQGAEIGRTKKQASVEVTLPAPTADEVIGYLSVADSAVSKLILDACTALIASQVRSQFDEKIESFGDDDTKEVTVNDLDFGKLSLEYIATIPTSQRGGTAISDEDYELFFTDYLQVMQVATGKEEKRIKLHLDYFRKPNSIKANKPVLNLLTEQLDIYLATSQNLEDTGEAASRIRSKFMKWATEPAKAIDLNLL